MTKRNSVNTLNLWNVPEEPLDGDNTSVFPTKSSTESQKPAEAYPEVEEGFEPTFVFHCKQVMSIYFIPAIDV